MKLKQWIEMQGNYYGQDWSDTVVDILIHISEYMDESDMDKDDSWARLQNLIIENVEIANNSQLKLYDLIAPHIDILNERLEQEWDEIDFMDWLVYGLSGNSGIKFTQKVFETLKESIENPTMRTWIHMNLDSIRPYAKETYVNNGGYYDSDKFDEWTDEELINTLFEDYSTRCEYQTEKEIKEVFNPSFESILYQYKYALNESFSASAYLMEVGETSPMYGERLEARTKARNKARELEHKLLNFYKEGK